MKDAKFGIFEGVPSFSIGHIYVDFQEPQEAPREVDFPEGPENMGF